MTNQTQKLNLNNLVTGEFNPESLKSKLKRFGIIPSPKNLFFLVIGAFIAAIGINIFYLPLKFTMGGVSGIAAILYYIFGDIIPFGTLTFLLNIPIIIIGFKVMSLSFIIRSIIGLFFFSGVIDLTAPFCAIWYQGLYTPVNGVYPDPIIFAVVGGVIFGFGLGLFFLAGYTTGGVDILAVALTRIWPSISLGKSILIMDVIIISLSLIIPADKAAPSPVLLAMYSFLSLYISTIAIDVCMTGFDFKRTAYIISSKHEEIAQAIMNNVERGVTGLYGKGMYTSNDKMVLFCVLSTRQIKKLKSLVISIDPQAFIVVTDTKEVLGEGFANNEDCF